MNSNNVIYFNSFGIGHIPKEIKQFKTKYHNNICRVQEYSLIMCGYFCTGFIDFMLKGKSLLDYTNFFSPKEYANW